MTTTDTAIMLQLARKARLNAAIQRRINTKVYKSLNAYLKDVRALEIKNNEIPDPRPMTAIDIPEILTTINRALHDQMERDSYIDPSRIPEAVSLFISILTGR